LSTGYGSGQTHEHNSNILQKLILRILPRYFYVKDKFSHINALRLDAFALP
jgi:hypothetical protein